MIFDLLASDITVAGQSDFTVPAPGPIDIAVNNVGVNGLPFFNAVGGSFFTLGDNIKIFQAWAEFYFGFGQGGQSATLGGWPHNIGLAFWDGAAFSLLDCFPYATRSLVIPKICDPVELGPEGVYSVMPTTGIKRQIRLSNIDVRASLINVPAALVGQVIKVQYFLSVGHTLPLTVVP